ncbi:MFS transporter [Paludibaculum fermentans]|uniref:MFS transporter n=1 Tax=Paludibaculum fermentans TaxID=1473598 RepID=A0A7S7SP93_PALFE|nr:MFS transporter [Paludibaculum fermentans]QOY91341.1 MFS transporter [Paludibaculum fermentans]
MRLRTMPVFLAFLAMGFADAVGPFVSLAKNEFQLSNSVASLIPFVGFSMFGLLSVPVGLLQDKKGKKFVLMMGLLVALLGLLNASIGLGSFAQFLVTVMLVGAGAAILQVAGNPIMRDVSEEGKYARNLSLGQFIKAIGSLSGPMIPVIAAKYFGADWKVIFLVYTGALILTILAVAPMKVEEKKAEHKAATLASCLALLKNGYALAMVGAIFVYVGAEVSVSAGIPLFLKERFGLEIAKVGLLGTGLFFTALTVGRFSGGVILNWMSPRKFFLVTCGISILGLLGLFIPDQNIAVASFFLTGIGFANIFPLVFAIAVESMPSHVNELSGLMVTAIVGAAFVPPLTGLVADGSTVQLSFLVPLACVLYITWAALMNLKTAKA